MLPQIHVAHNWVPVGSLCLLKVVFTHVPLSLIASLTCVPLRRPMDSEYNLNDLSNSFLAQWHPGHYVQATKTSLGMTKNEALLKKTLRHSQNGQKGQRTECRATQPRTANLVGRGPWCCWTFWKSRFTSCHCAPGSWPSYHPCHQHGEDCCHPWENFLKPRWDLISHARNWQQSQWHVLLQGFGKTVPS